MLLVYEAVLLPMSNLTNGIVHTGMHQSLYTARMDTEQALGQGIIKKSVLTVVL